MKWSPIRRGMLLGIDWSTQSRKRLDPYLVWADVSGFKGVATGPAHAGLRPPEDQRFMRLALELSTAGGGIDVPFKEIARSGDSLFATASVPLDRVKHLLASPAVERLEFGFLDDRGIDRSSAHLHPPERVAGPVVAVIDFGCAFAQERFRLLRHGAWKSRIAYLWDQGRMPKDVGPGKGFWNAVPDMGYGRETTGQNIDRLLLEHRASQGFDEDAIYRAADYDCVAKVWTHGTHVLDLAAGAPFDIEPADAPSIIFVQLPEYAVDDTSGGSMVTHVMDALRYILDRAAPDAPVVVNLSYGSMAGPHDGSTLLESAMDALIESQMGPLSARRVRRHFSIVLPAGNNFESDGHATLCFGADHADSQTLQWQVMAEDTTDTFLEVWYPREAADHVEVIVKPPGCAAQASRVDTSIALHAEGSPDPLCAVMHQRSASSGAGLAMALIALAPTAASGVDRALAPYGIYEVTVSLVDKKRLPHSFDVQVWIERDDPPIGSTAPRQSRLLTGRLPLRCNEESPPGSVVRRESTCSSIANGTRTVVVGACLARADLARPEATELSRYSSEGPTFNPARPRWPDLVADGDESRTLAGMPAAGTRSGTSVRMDGTSVAAPELARKLIAACERDPWLPLSGLIARITRPIETESPDRTGDRRLES